MNTTNLISTPNIEGNIGSCETKTVESFTRNGILTETKQVIMTNSCTGQIVKDYTYDSYSGLYGLVVIGMLFTIVVLVAVASD